MGTVHRGHRPGVSEHDHGYKWLFSEPKVVEEQISSVGELDKLTRKALRAKTLQEMGLG